MITTLTDQDIHRNRRAVRYAIKQQELEGLKVPASTVADLHRVARDGIDTNEVIRNIYRRLQNVLLLQQRSLSISGRRGTLEVRIPARLETSFRHT